jgi:DNA-binding GntR family transcriptional regulator
MFDLVDLSGTSGETGHTAFAALSARKIELMRSPLVQQGRNDEEKTEEARFLIIRKIRDAILDQTFKPGERLPEEQVGKMFNVSRSPVREVLLALEKEGTVVMEPYKGATVKPLSPAEALDIAELRLSLITLAAKPAYRHLSPTDFDLAYGLAKQTTRTNSAKEYFEYDRRFWDMIFEKTQRPILWEVFRQLDDRLTRYYPLFLKLFPDSATRPRQREVLIEFLREGKVEEAVRAFKKIYLEVVRQMIDYLHTEDSQPARKGRQGG